MQTQSSAFTGAIQTGLKPTDRLFQCLFINLVENKSTLTLVILEVILVCALFLSSCIIYYSFFF